MKSKILSSLLIISSLFGYLEWGENKRAFLIQVEFEIFSKIMNDAGTLLHPLILIPLLGQILLLLTLFQKNPNKTITFIGIGCIGIIMAMLFLIACLNINYLMLLATIPFLVISVFTIRHHLRS